MLNVTRLLACACSLAVVALFVFVQFGMAGYYASVGGATEGI